MASKACKSSKKRKHGEDPGSHCSLTSSSTSAGAEGIAATTPPIQQEDQKDAELLSENNRKAASQLAACRVALLHGSDACWDAIEEFDSPDNSDLEEALDEVRGYYEEDCPPLHYAVMEDRCGSDVATVKTLITAGADINAYSFGSFGYSTPLKLASGNCRQCYKILKHHASILSALKMDPTALLRTVIAEHPTLPAPAAGGSTSLTAALPLRKYQRDPSFLWAPDAARTAVIAWARDAFIFQHTTVKPFLDLPSDCLSDTFEYLRNTMTRTESLHMATQDIAPEARAWVRAVIREAVGEADRVTLYPTPDLNADPETQSKQKFQIRCNKLVSEYQRIYKKPN